MLKTDYILSFTHAAIAKVKGYNGRFYFTVGTSVEKEILMKLEETSDCVIEMQVYEEGGVQKRRLRVKKVRGRKHIERWIPFSIEPGRGIVFHVSRLQKK
jgi:KaiC/GvpD/RAD55 family RecA-like ATPase